MYRIQSQSVQFSLVSKDLSSIYLHSFLNPLFPFQLNAKMVPEKYNVASRNSNKDTLRSEEKETIGD
jgi:hypothetical protein